jgi:hypothetical protein
MGQCPIRLNRSGPYLFGASPVVFGVDHFLVLAVIASLLPAWLPGGLFWAGPLEERLAKLEATLGLAPNLNLQTPRETRDALLGCVLVLRDGTRLHSGKPAVGWRSESSGQGGLCSREAWNSESLDLSRLPKLTRNTTLLAFPKTNQLPKAPFIDLEGIEQNPTQA